MRILHLASRVLLRGIGIAVAMLVLTAPWAAPAHAGGGQTNLDGIAGSMPAYYDSTLFTINFKEFPAGSEATLIGQNTQLNFIYQSDPGLPGGKPFISVIDAITAAGPGFNPLWQEVQIAFNPGFTPRQLFSDDEIKAAAASGEVTLTTTTELYRCSVIGAAPRITNSTPTSVAAPVQALGGIGTPTTGVSTWGTVKAMYQR